MISVGLLIILKGPLRRGFSLSKTVKQLIRFEVKEGISMVFDCKNWVCVELYMQNI